jgi:DNA-binding CsgD family transcriptional regulator
VKFDSCPLLVLGTILLRISAFMTESHSSKLLGYIYEAASDPELWNPFLKNLAGLTKADCAALPFHDASGHEIYSDWEFDPELAHLHKTYYHSVDIWWLRGNSLPPKSVITSQKLCSLSELKTTEVYNDCLLRFDIQHGLFALLENTATSSASVSLFRNASNSEFDDADVRLLRSLADHMERAFKLSKIFSESRARCFGLEAALNGVSCGVLCLDAKGKLVFANTAAQALLYRKDGLDTIKSKLVATRRDESLKVEQAVTLAIATSGLNGTSSGTTIFVSRRNQPPLELEISPVRLPNGTFQNVAAIVFIRAPLQSRRPTRESLTLRFGLSPAETRVALLLSEGHSLRQISEMLGVSFHTVRSQTKSIFGKTDVRRQSELVRILLS